VQCSAVQCIAAVLRSKNTPRGRNAEVFNVKAVGVCNKHFALKVTFIDATSCRDVVLLLYLAMLSPVYRQLVS